MKDRIHIDVFPHPERPGIWLAHCLDFDLVATGESKEATEDALVEAILFYIETISDTTDVASIPRLLRRRAPWWCWALYYRRRLWAWRIWRSRSVPAGTK